MCRRNRSTRSGGIPLPDDPLPAKERDGDGRHLAGRCARSSSWCARAAGSPTCRR